MNVVRIFRETSGAWAPACGLRPRQDMRNLSAGLFHERSGGSVTDRKIIPFRKRAPSEKELEVYRRMTRNWPPALRQLLLPEHFSLEGKAGPDQDSGVDRGSAPKA